MAALPQQPPEDDPIFRMVDGFPLGRPFGRVEVSQAQPSGPLTRPFGLRYLTVPPPEAVVAIPTDRITYDDEHQIALLDGEPLHAQKHTSGKTETPTYPDPSPDGSGTNAPDKIEDTEPD